jgi:hypothetical protein
MIVSLTSHGARLKYVGMAIYSVIKHARFHVVLTIYKDDVSNIPTELDRMIKAGVVELIVSDVDLGPHLKYYWAMKRYKSTPIITIDDDCLYTDDFCDSMITAYNKYPNAVSCRRAHLITISNGIVNPYSQWIQCIDMHDNFRHICPTGVGGVLYPPNIIDIDSIDLAELTECLYNDDIYLKVVENRRNIPIHIIHTNHKHPIPQKHTEVLSVALCRTNVGGNRNDKYIQRFNNDLK